MNTSRLAQIGIWTKFCGFSRVSPFADLFCSFSIAIKRNPILQMGPKKRKSEEVGSVNGSQTKLNRTSSNFDDIDFNVDKESKEGKKANFKISTWNVDGIRAWVTKGGLQFFKHEQPDVICLQETKCSKEKLPAEIKNLKDYPYQYWSCATKEGYSGVGLLSKVEPVSVNYGLGKEEFDNEGRLITADFGSFYLISTYVPNSGRGLVTLPKRLEWDPILREHMKKLDEEKPVILCGDLNVAHKEIDLANPKTNKKTAGFTQEERDSFTTLLETGFVDTFRNFYPDKEKVYTFWTYMGNSRAKNVGWRLDYFVASERLMPKVCEVATRDQVFGSDHCPSTLFLAK